MAGIGCRETKRCRRIVAAGKIMPLLASEIRDGSFLHFKEVLESPMSISSVGSRAFDQLRPTTQRYNANTGAVATSDGSQATASSSASTVTLSADAQALASLNSIGITMRYIDYSGLSSGKQPPALGGANGAISQAGFESVVESFGGTAEDAAEVFSAADTDNNGSISNSELLGAMSSTGNSTDSAVQRLLHLMDTNHDGSVNGTEFLDFETAMVQAQTPES